MRVGVLKKHPCTREVALSNITASAVGLLKNHPCVRGVAWSNITAKHLHSGREATDIQGITTGRCAAAYPAVHCRASRKAAWYTSCCPPTHSSMPHEMPPTCRVSLVVPQGRVRAPQGRVRAPQRRVRAPYVASWAGSAELPVIRLSRYGPARRARASHYFRLWRGVVTSCCDLLRPTSPRLPEKRENCCLILSFGTTLKGLLDPEGVSGAVGLL